jgi:hypothetical protein
MGTSGGCVLFRLNNHCSWFVLSALWLLYNVNDNVEVTQDIPNCTSTIKETATIKEKFRMC